MDTTKLRVFSAAVMMAALSSVPVAAKHNGATLNDDRGAFQIIGSVKTNSCAAQANVTSAAGKSVGLSLYWTVGESLHLLVAHPEATVEMGKQQLKFLFPDGTTFALRLVPSGSVLQTRLGLDSIAPTMFKAVKANPSLTVEFVDIADNFIQDLSQWENVMAGMEDCQNWLE